MCERTPRAHIDLPSSHEAPRMARDFLRLSVCAEHRVAALDDAVLVTSEAITNAVRHGAPPITLAVDCVGQAVEIRVRDASPRPPRRQHPGDGHESGRGVALIDTLSDDWGVDQHVGGGKDVWFRLNSR